LDHPAVIIDDDGFEAFEDDREAYRRAKNGAIISDEGEHEEHIVDWSRDLKVTSIELSDAIGSCDRAAVLAIPGAAETVEVMRRLCDEIGGQLTQR
jgi:hypothetical protein